VKTEQEAIDRLAKGLEILAADLGAMIGLNQRAFDQVCDSLRFLAREWRGRDLIPRRVVAELWGVTDIMINVSERYGSVEGPRLCDKAAQLNDLIVECLTGE
jgi:hypothetical protein